MQGTTARGLCSAGLLPSVGCMAERRTSKKIAARDRVRQIRARLDAEKAERERRLYEIVTAFHEARVERDEALASAGRHEAAMAAHLGDLVGMDEPLERAATLCDMTESEARSLRRRDGREIREPRASGVRPH